MGNPEPIKIMIIKKCPKLLRIYGNYLGIIYLLILFYFSARFLQEAESGGHGGTRGKI